MSPKAGEWPERDLVPYEASSFSARTALVLAAHPDDEVFGCGAALAVLARQGAAIHALLVSDGAGMETEPAERRRIAEVRRAESRAALELLGGGTVHTMDFPDRGLDEASAQVERALATFFVAHPPDLVFVPSPVEVHPDHRALAETFLRLARQDRGPAAFVLAAATVAFYELSQPIRPNFLLDATAAMDAKETAMAAFASQNTGHDYPGYMRGLNAYRRMTLPATVAAAEAYYVVPGHSLHGRPLASLARAIGPYPERERAGLGARLYAALFGDAEP